MRATILLLFLPTLFFCRRSAEEPIPTQINPVPERIDILALGDSYTKGESVPWGQNFPNQLADSLRMAGFDLAGLHVVAQTGWRTDNLQSAIASQASVLADSTFSLVTLCIGVNNQYQNANFETYKTEFEALLKYAIARAGGRKERVVVISIPDWAYTPYGQNSNPALISQKIDQYNAANRSITEAFGVPYVNVTDVSRRGIQEPDLVAFDGLHPSAQQYTEWVRLLLPVVKMGLKP
ncbi:MAG: SGNH/GDSL hydrolase family protein [Phycisphaerae bacterium]|nr:SGNH/GDSL hydrolase family protein [Saprospiraceae bacterium]